MNALDIAESIAERVERETRTSNVMNFALGSAGNALFFFALAQSRSSERWARAAHESLKRAASAGGATYPGLFIGLAGLLFVSAYAARIDPRYTSLRDQCIKALIASGATEPAFRAAKSVSEYDLVSGVAGIHAALLYAGCTAHARGTRAYLEWLAGDDERWSCAHDADAGAQRANDVGVAHGMAGVLSVLAGDDDVAPATIEGIADAFWNTRVPNTTLWPSSVGPFTPAPTRAGWCYGNPGAAMVFLRVANRTTSGTAAERARLALHEVIALPRDSWRQVDYALCHGAAGNALIFQRAAAALGDERIAACASDLLADLIRAYDGSLTFGYRNWDNGAQCWGDDPTLLNGAAGIGLALVTLGSEIDDSWIASFGLPTTLTMATGMA